MFEYHPGAHAPSCGFANVSKKATARTFMAASISNEAFLIHQYLECDILFHFYLQLMKLAAGLQSRASTCSGSSVFSPARTFHSLVCSHSNTFHCWEAHISNTKSAVGTKIRTVQQHDVYHTKSRLTSVFIWCY